MFNISKITLSLIFSVSHYNFGFSQNVINGTANSETIIGTPANDIIYAGGGTVGDDVYGRAGDDLLFGQNGPDFLFGQDGADEYFGGPGIDEVIFLDLHQNTQGVIANLKDQSIANDGFGHQETMSSIEQIGAGTVFPDFITGDDLDNILIAWGAGDTIDGLSGDDRIEADAAGIYNGNTGRDTLVLTSDYYYTPDADNDGLWEHVTASPNEVVEVNLETEQILNDGFGNSGQAISFRNISVIAPSQSIILTGDISGNEITTRSDFPVVIRGAAGNDTIRGNGRLEGGDGDDTIRGTGDIFGGNGNDRIVIDYQISPASTLNNTVSGGAGNDTIIAQSGDDHITGNGGDDLINSKNGNDRITGNAGNDVLNAGFGNDVLYGGDGRDGLDAEFGNDIIFFDNLDSYVYGGRGYDKAIATQNSGQLNLEIPQYTTREPAFTGIEQVWASQSDDVLDGSQSPTFLKLFGQAGNDTIIGSPQGDRIYGELGNDIMTGNAGNDRFFFDVNWGNDTITDFGNGTDRMSLSAAGVTSISQLNITQNGADTRIEYGGNSIILIAYDYRLLNRTNFVFASVGANDPAAKDDPATERAKLLELIK